MLIQKYFRLGSAPEKDRIWSLLVSPGFKAGPSDLEIHSIVAKIVLDSIQPPLLERYIN